MKKPVLWTLALLAALLSLPAAAVDAPPADLAAPSAECAAPAAAAPAGDQPLFLAGEICGSRICGKGTYCCNASCSMCVLVGMSCTQQACFQAEVQPAPAEVDHGGLHWEVPCGNTVCTGGNFCCNASCSICAPRGGHCTQQVCPPTS